MSLIRKHKLDLPPGFVKLRGLWIRLIIVIIIIFVLALFIRGRLIKFLGSADYFKVKDIVFGGEDIIDLSYLKGEQIFMLDLRKESLYIAEHYPVYRKIRLTRVLPNRIFVDFVKRKAVALVRLYRYFYVDEEAILFNAPDQLLGEDLPIILGLETKIFGPKSGRKYNIKELRVALKIIKELNLNRGRDYKVKRVDVANLNSISFSIVVPLKPEFYPRTETISAIKELEIKLDVNDMKDKIGILGSLLKQIKNELVNIKYIDLRFKEPVIKLRDAK